MSELYAFAGVGSATADFSNTGVRWLVVQATGMAITAMIRPVMIAAEGV
jgi:hypothetical protein